MTGEPVTTGAQGAEGSGASGSPDASATVGTGAQEMVPKERFDGLMGSLNREKAEKERLQAELDRVSREKQEKAESVLTDDVRQLIEAKVNEAKAQTSTVFNSLKATTTKALLEKYPFATEDAVRGNTPEEWETSAKAEHERVKTIVEAREKAAREAADEEARKTYGAPLGVGPGGARPAPPKAEDIQAQLKAAKERGDALEVTRLTLLLPLANQSE